MLTFDIHDDFSGLLLDDYWINFYHFYKYKLLNIVTYTLTSLESNICKIVYFNKRKLQELLFSQVFLF